MKVTKGKLKHGKVSATSTSGVSRPPPPVPPTTPYNIFQNSIARAKNLLEIHRLAHGAQARPSAFLADAHRAAIVLAVSALDAYVRTFVITRIVKLVGNPLHSLPAKLRSDIIECLGQDGILDAARKGDLTVKIEKAFKDRFETQSFQGVRKISDAMKLVGYDDIFVTMAASASVNEANLKRDLGVFTTRRHVVAHRGDYDLDQTPPAENRILKRDVLACIKTVELIAREIEKLP